MRGPMIITEGMKIYDEGVKIGIDSGRALERDENAKIMLFDGVSDDLVIKYSGISTDRLEKLKVEMAKS